jgi:chromosome segregation protein
MRLERLEISGFKSFSDRAELAFDQGVTAIVGPNGCGKSNLADAITWVLGEQSAKSLRGDRMEDVIFNGSDGRRAGATAEVRLRLSGLAAPSKAASEALGASDARSLVPFAPADGNGNGHHPDADPHGNGNGHRDGRLSEVIEALTRDVEVTRRLYRSGESEYLIDGEVCRLRDVHELLMDTGLGAKAYAIIEQGKIGMILSSRPADRRQLVEEAAGITKYRSRRRAAELKLEAAQQNLVRIDDIVFEVEKQRGALKRQAAKARRYKRLHDEWRRWEKVLFARRYRELAASIEAARARLAEARQREAAAAAGLAAAEAALARLRIEQAEADNRAAAEREDAHGRELDINRRQQQLEFNRQHAETLAARAENIEAELRDLGARRAPARLLIESRQRAAAEAERARDQAAALLAEANEAYSAAQRQIEGLDADVEAARSEVFAVINTATALRHAMDHAAAQKERVGETLSKLDVELADVRVETERVEGERVAAAGALSCAQRALEAVQVDRAARESELVRARAEHEARVRGVRSREQELAGLGARLASLEELEASRAGFGDAARMVLMGANGQVGQRGAVADYLEVESRYERAAEACLGDLLEHVIVDDHGHAAAGLALVREHDAGRCGFVVIEGLSDDGNHPPNVIRMPGVVPLYDVVRLSGPYASTLQKVLPEAYIVDNFERAVGVARETSAFVATLEGDVFRGPHQLAGGAKAEARGILQTKREIKELRERAARGRETLARLIDETSALELRIAQSIEAIATLTSEQHRQEKAMVGHEAQLARSAEDAVRLGRKTGIIALERRRAEEERTALEARCAEVEVSIEQLAEAQRLADMQLTGAQRRLYQARETVDGLGQRAAEARATYAGLVERAAALAAEVARLEEGSRELEERVAAKASELGQIRDRRAGLLDAVVEAGRMLDQDVLALEGLRENLRAADAHAATLRERVDAQDAFIRDARRRLEDVRAQAADLEVARATEESDLSHLAQRCVDAVQCPLDEVLADVAHMEQSGDSVREVEVIAAEEADPEGYGEPAEASGGAEAVAGSPAETSSSPTTPEEAIAQLKAKIDRLGPVNMMAIEQFDELETRHAFLTTQRKDLVDSIAHTTEVITRIDETTRARFREAFTAIQYNFQKTFTTLFGGGRAGLTLLDENDPLESGIDIVASPPGKRLQNVQLLSGGEKALTAIALMFAIFEYKPSPFCVLDEIDAPLDDANVGRFVEMLRGMLGRTQFILITHNRRTMEIANRLYGVTMEEPGVSKLISVRLN